MDRWNEYKNCRIKKKQWKISSLLHSLSPKVSPLADRGRRINELPVLIHLSIQIKA
jgi:hypothetical protein